MYPERKDHAAKYTLHSPIDCSNQNAARPKMTWTSHDARNASPHESSVTPSASHPGQ